MAKAGAARVDITPALGTLVNGDFIPHYATYIHDRMYAKALVLQNAGTKVGFCIVDICAMKRDLLDEVKLMVHQQTGILPENLLISSTHSHASGSVESLLLCGADLAYRQKLPALIARSVEEACEKLCAATIGFGSIQAPEYVLCRRYEMKEGYEARNPVTGGLDQVKTNPFGGEGEIIGPISIPDPELCYLAVRKENGEWLSVLANYSLHYVGDWENGTISPDYFGAFSKNLKDKLGAGDDCVLMMSNGTSGEINIWDFMHPSRFPKGKFEKSNLIGADLAERVFQSLENIKWQVDCPIAAAYQEVTIATRKPDAESLERYKKIVGESSYENIKEVDYPALVKLYAREQVLLDEYPDSISFPLQAIKIGNTIIGALGGEFFAETGLALKQAVPNAHYFTITLANDYVGYVCPEHEMERGGYETWRCRTSFLELPAEKKLREKLLELIKKVGAL